MSTGISVRYEVAPQSSVLINLQGGFTKSTSRIQKTTRSTSAYGPPRPDLVPVESASGGSHTAPPTHAGRPMLYVLVASPGTACFSSPDLASAQKQPPAALPHSSAHGCEPVDAIGVPTAAFPSSQPPFSARRSRGSNQVNGFRRPPAYTI
jgi:hypothetical protein